jgi:hypothetical protein
MSLKQVLANDLDVFYNSDEFAISAVYNSHEISVLSQDDIGFENSDIKVVSAKSSDVVGIAKGDTISIDGVAYRVNNYEYKDDMKLEMMIGLVK